MKHKKLQRKSPDDENEEDCNVTDNMSDNEHSVDDETSPHSELHCGTDYYRAQRDGDAEPEIDVTNTDDHISIIPTVNRQRDS